MAIIEILERINNTYGLIIVLKDILWDFDGINKSNQKQFTGILALIDTIEQNTYNIKVLLESSITIQGK